MTNRNGSMRGLLTGALAVLAISWLMPAARLPEAASVQVPDAGHQRQQMLEELRTMNKRLAEISGLIKESREAQAKAEKDAAGASRVGKP